MISPTPGRVVWYYAAPYELHLTDDLTKPLAAHVAFVHHDRLVNLMVIDAWGKPQSHVNVPLMQDTADSDINVVRGGYCTWMPFQKSQAAKTEALEAELKLVKAKEPAA